jgi:hypothetical protein
VRRRIPAGERGELEVRALAGALGKEWSEEATEGALTALTAAGAMRLLGEPLREGPRGTVLPVGVHARIPELERARTLRAAALAKLEGVVAYARSRSCRRAALLSYFGEGDVPERCGGCDRCAPMAPAPPRRGPLRRLRTP